MHGSLTAIELVPLELSQIPVPDLVVHIQTTTHKHRENESRRCHKCERVGTEVPGEGRVAQKKRPPEEAYRIRRGQSPLPRPTHSQRPSYCLGPAVPRRAEMMDEELLLLLLMNEVLMSVSSSYCTK